MTEEERLWAAQKTWTSGTAMRHRLGDLTLTVVYQNADGTFDVVRSFFLGGTAHVSVDARDADADGMVEALFRVL